MPSSASLCSLLLCASLLLVAVSGQSYSPYPYPVSSCTSGQSLFTLGNSSLADYNFGVPSTLYAGAVWLQPLNNSALGGVVSQLSLGLGDNSGNLLPVHLRLGLYLLSSTGSQITATLLGQTDEITLWPSPAQVLYGNMLTPVSLLSDQLLALGVWADSPVLIGAGVYGTGLYGSNGFGLYVDYTLPSSLSYVYTGYYQAPAMAATGCITPGFLSSSSSQVFVLCAYTDQYWQALPPLAYLNSANTLYTQLTATVVVSTANPVVTSFGTGYTVTGVSGQLSQQWSGMYYYDVVATVAGTAVTLGGSKITGVTPSNLLYLTGSGAAALVDGNGLSMVTASGTQVVLQWSASTSQYQTVNSTNNGAAPSPSILYSGASMTQVTTQTQLQGVVPTCAPKTVYTPDVVPTCAAGSVPVTYGDVTKAFVTEPGEFDSITDANEILFRPFTVNAATSISSLQYLMLENPSFVVHMRLGLFSIGGSSGAPTYSLLSQSNPITIANPASDVVVTANLQSAVSLSLGTYAIGVWFDQAVYSAYTSWAYGAVFSSYLSFITVNSQGAFPSSVVGQAGYQVASVGAVGCAPSSAGTVQFAVCATFTYAQYYSTYYDTYAGVVTAIATKQTNSFGSYYPLIAAYGNYTAGYSQVVPFRLGGFSQQTNNLLYDPTTTSSGQVVDSSGIGLIWGLCYTESGGYVYCDIGASVLSSVAVPYSTRYAAQEAVDTDPYSSVYSVTAAAVANISYSVYTGGQVVCPTSAAAPPINAVIPASVSSPTCSGITSTQLQVGDGNILDYANNKEGNAVSGNVVYTNTFTAVAGWSISALSVDVLLNLGSPVSIQLALYSPSNALVGQTQTISLVQVIDQPVTASLLTPVTLVSGKYLIALLANSTLNIATSSVQTPSMQTSAAVLPSSFSSTTTAPAVPLLALGCATATHSFCAYFQFYTPGGPVSSTYLYQGLLSASAGGTNSFGSYLTVNLLQGHMTVETRLATAITSTPSTAGIITLAPASSGNIYTSSSSGSSLDSTGLTITTGTGWTTTLSFTSNGTTDSAAAAIYGAAINAAFNVTALASTGNAVPTCSILYMPTQQSPANPALPSCPAGQTLVSYGDMVGTDYAEHQEEIYYNENGLIITVPFTTNSTTPTMIYQIGVGVNNNFNVVSRITFALYDAYENLLGTTNEVRVVNSQDQMVIGTLLTPLLLQPNTTYLVAEWTDTSIYQSFTYAVNPCVFLPYGSGWPASLSAPSLEADTCATVALGGYGCTVAVTPSSSSSSSGGGGAAPASPLSSSSSGSQSVVPTNQLSSSSSSGNTLSGGAIAGIVIGCVVGSNLLLLVCLLGVCGLRPAGNAKQQQQQQRTGENETSSREEPASRNTQSRVEMISREQ